MVCGPWSFVFGAPLNFENKLLTAGNFCQCVIFGLRSLDFGLLCCLCAVCVVCVVRVVGVVSVAFVCVYVCVL